MKPHTSSSQQRQSSVCITSLILLLVMWVSLADAANTIIARGAAVAQTCMVCHGPGGHSTGAIPSLAGTSTHTLRDALLAFRSGERSGTVMNRLARGLNDADIEAVALYFSTPSRR